MKPAEVLRNAASIIAHVGHSQRYYEEREDTHRCFEEHEPYAPTGPITGFCVYGAMSLVARNGASADYTDFTDPDIADLDLGSESRAIVKHLGLPVDCGDYFTAVTQWNDAHDGSTVADAMLATAAQLEEDENHA